MHHEVPLYNINVNINKLPINVTFLDLNIAFSHHFVYKHLQFVGKIPELLNVIPLSKKGSHSYNKSQ
jgi:hypothetical protein